MQEFIDDFCAVLPRVYDRDFTVFGNDPSELADRLNWLIAPHTTPVETINDFATDVASVGVDQVILCGMGGSSLYARTLAPFATNTSPTLTVVDTTDPDVLRRIDAQVNYQRAFVLVASKSGTTIETAAQEAFFAHRLEQHHGLKASQRLGVITDPASALATEAVGKGYRHVLLADPQVGGRFSAHTMFGIAPAALVGIDPWVHLRAAEQTFAQLAKAAPNNPAVVLAAHLCAAVIRSGGVATLGIDLADVTDPLGLWIEQLIAESLGKQGQGLHVLLRPLSQADLMVKVVRDKALTAARLQVSDDQRVLTLSVPDGHLGVAVSASVFMLATALAGRGIGVNPFDQPDVAAAKKATATALRERTVLEAPSTIDDALANANHRDSVVVLAYADPESALADRLWQAAATLGVRRNVAVSVGFGPRYLHSTGQLHKGALADACYLLIGPSTALALPVPGEAYGFETLFAAQAAGDVIALRDCDRNVTVITADELSRYISTW